MPIEKYLKIDRGIKGLYAYLKRYNIEKFFLKKEFNIALMELNADKLWKDIYNYVCDKSGIAVLSSKYTGDVDEAFPIFINYIYLEDKEKFLNIFDYIIQEFILSEKLKAFDYNVLYNRILQCDFNQGHVISKMPFLSSKLKLEKGKLKLKKGKLKLKKAKAKVKKVEMEDLVKRMTEGELIILEGIESSKFDDIIEQFHIIGTIYKWIFITENILRKFIIQILLKSGFQDITSLDDSKFNDKINKRKKQEESRKYLPIRGDHDIFYLDLIDLVRFFQKHWKYFKDYFDSQPWICQRIGDLYAIRVRVAHNSSNISQDELISVTAYCKEIIKQINPYI